MSEDVRRLLGEPGSELDGLAASHHGQRAARYR